MSLAKKLLCTVAKLKKSKVHQDESGMSLIEIIIVIALLGTIMTLVVGKLTEASDNAREDAAKIAITQLDQQLQVYKIQNYSYPATLDDLVTKPADAKKWRGPYVAEEKLKDPWNTTFSYEKDGAKYKIISAGADQTFGTEDDIVFPDNADNNAE